MRALLSVYDKTGLVPFARALRDLGYDLISTGGTQLDLEAAGLDVTSVATVTGSPEMLDGRVKTLHPAIHGALLARTDLPHHQSDLDAHGIVPIDVVVVNLYPFADTVADPATPFADAMEQIDIGGPAMLRAAAKNHDRVTVVCSPRDYDRVSDALRSGASTGALRRDLAAKAFSHVSAYDAIVADYLRDPAGAGFPAEYTVSGTQAMTLRYGENPGQAGTAYARRHAGSHIPGILDARQLGGKELSFNNLLDADAAWNIIRGLDRPAVAIIKHTIPCGCAIRKNLDEAYAAALAGDPVSAFGGIVACNREIDEATARSIATTFYEVITAPSFSAEAQSVLGRKANLRLLELPAARSYPVTPPWDVRPISGGLLVQQTDTAPDNAASWRVVTSRGPTDDERRDLAFAWQVVRHVKSNGIVFVANEAVVGVGSGQPNRLESIAIASRKAASRANGAAMASDAFFPFADNVEAAHAAGITAIVQPGGSVRDAEVIAAADEAEIAMVFTGTRHFKH
ncbi:MAG: bifunctional phosphoribosylaminoimidazolecarboxamide formyltransferase/IMP cyclohydrolase [Thermomicrobiales bacterium]